MGYVLLSQGMSPETRLLPLFLLILLAVILMFKQRKKEQALREKPYHYCSCSDQPYDWRECREDLLYAWEYCVVFCFVRLPFLKKIFKKTTRKYFIPDDEIIWEKIKITDEYIEFRKKEKIPRKKYKK